MCKNRTLPLDRITTRPGVFSHPHGFLAEPSLGDFLLAQRATLRMPLHIPLVLIDYTIRYRFFRNLQLAAGTGENAVFTYLSIAWAILKSSPPSPPGTYVQPNQREYLFCELIT